MKTYTQNRKCLHCGKPIADQEHGLQKFCPKEKLQDGSIKNCKDEYWSKIRKQEMAPFIAIAYDQREQFENIDLLLKTKGDKVSLEDINQHGINLQRPIEFKIDEKQYVFYYHKYAIKQLPDNLLKLQLMNYIDNSDLFNQFPENNRTPKGSKIAIGILVVLTLGAIGWAVTNQVKLNEENKEGNVTS